MNEAYLLSAARTPIGRFLGAFKHVSAPDLGASVIREAIRRAGLQATDIDEVIMGNVLSAGLGQAPARQAALKAGLPSTIAAVAVNKVCGSGLKAIMFAAQAVRLGDARIVAAGGMENMSRTPHLLRGGRVGNKMGEIPLADSMLLDGLWCAFDDCHMGQHAEYTAQKWGITREAQDRYALQSQQRAARAMAAHGFSDEIVCVPVPTRSGDELITTDEGPRPDTQLEQLGRLQPVFETAGSVTAGNASLLADGAAAVIVADESTAQAAQSPWKARIVAYHTSGVEPRDLFIAPVEAIRGVLRKADLQAKDVHLFEINEAFASQTLACMRELKLDNERVNINGGAIALGHPIGASGARVLVTLLSALRHTNQRIGLATLCLGGGNAVAMIVERVA